MKNRAVEIAGFLAQHGWDNAADTPLDADFSTRRFARLQHDDGRRAVLMDADGGQKTPDFIAVDKLLRDAGIAAPEIFAADPMLGLVLMEDFGGRNFGRSLDTGMDAAPFYRRGIDVLVHLHKNFDKMAAKDVDLPMFGGALFAAQVETFIDAYFPHVKGREATPDEAEGFRAAWKITLKGIENLPQTLMLRDYMPDNLMDLPKREGIKATGVLDFQDAGHGPIAYDIASLCEVVRRDGGDKYLDEMIGYYHEHAHPAISIEELKTACHILAAQRHMRILGPQWVNISDQHKKQTWFLRIIKYLEHLFKNEALKPVRLWAEQHDIFKASWDS